MLSGNLVRTVFQACCILKSFILNTHDFFPHKMPFYLKLFCMPCVWEVNTLSYMLSSCILNSQDHDSAIKKYLKEKIEQRR